ncbi:MAG: hypothetical protein JW742_09095 [Candidatus Aminicenantes bacterium]|nr:hypothetical protein [Candidatus Aminicenantes bacterium]
MARAMALGVHAFLLCLLSRFLLSADSRKLPSLSGLPELSLELIADFSDCDDLASTGLPVLFSDGSLFAYDSRRHELLRTDLGLGRFKPVAGQGEGPAEIAGGALDMLADGDELLVLDGKRKLLCFDKMGVFKRERRLPNLSWKKILGRSDRSLYLVGSTIDETGMHYGVFRVAPDDACTLIRKAPVLMIRTDAYSTDGKPMAGGGFFLLSSPAFELCLPYLAAAGSSRYEFEIMDLDAGAVSRVSFEEPDPPKIFGRVPYPILGIFFARNRVFILSLYLREKKPRLDVFSPSGERQNSYVLPLLYEHSPFDPEKILISDDYLIHADRKEMAGFRVYKYELK